jgi:bacterioferritin-associated ferredoxin
MYVCLCKGITDRQIKDAIYDGATSVGQLRKCLGVASQCGKCGITAREILQETLTAAPSINGMAQYYAVA